MPHQLQSMAYTGTTPWHQLGNELPPKQSIEAWTQQAGMDWAICETPVRYLAETSGSLGSIMSFADQKVLYRSDTKEALSVVGSRYQVVQPREVLEFYRDLTELSGFELETAGVLKAGRKFWALARTGKQVQLKGSDQVNGYLLLATSCDGTLATTATPTSIRVVCANTLNLALNGASCAVKVPHRSSFDAQAVKKQLGVAVSQWDSFMYRMKTLAERKVKSHEAMNYFLKVICQTPSVAGQPDMPSNLNNERALAKVQEIFDGRGRGAELASAKGTAWGLLNAVTEFVDHERRARNQEYRLDSAWFGQGALLKQRALEQALQMVS
jgi:phage/plasmid-like protein (TIGR03299 family)